MPSAPPDRFVETALKFGDGYLTIQDLSDPKQPRDLHFSEHLACPEHGSCCRRSSAHLLLQYTAWRLPECQGLGGKLEIDPDLLISDPDLSFNEGAIAISE